MDLSIIIPVYNVEDYIENCLESVYDQGLSISKFEVILINDGSTDNSYAVCENLQNKYSNLKLLNQKNSGASTARNLGIDHARGKYLYFIDSDDHLKSNYLNRFLEIGLTENLCFVGFSNFKTSNRYTLTNEIDELKFQIGGSGLEIMSEYNFNNGPWWYLVKKELLGDLRFIDGRLCEDGIFTCELLQYIKNGKIFSNEVYGYFSNINSTVHTKNIARLVKLKDDMLFAALDFNRIISLVPKDSPYYKKVFLRLRDRQESYLFFAFVRILKLQCPNDVLKTHLAEVKKSFYPMFPIKIFDGYNVLQNKILIKVFNNKSLFLIVNTLNRILPIIK